MNIEVNLGDRKSLLATREELRRLLGIVDFALGENTATVSVSPLPRRRVQGVITQADQPVIGAIDSLDQRFTSSQVYAILGEAFNRNDAKIGLRHAEAAGLIRLIERGQGRKPSTFEKIPQSN